MRHLPDLLRRHPLSLDAWLMFAFTWPLDLAVAAEARGWLPFDFPNGLELLVGYGFVLAALLMTALTLGRAGVVALLRRYLIWRVGPRWYGVVLFGPFAVDLAAVWLYAALRGSAPDVGPVMAHRLFGPSANLALLVLPFFLFDALTNGEEIGCRGCKPGTAPCFPALFCCCCAWFTSSPGSAGSAAPSSTACLSSPVPGPPPPRVAGSCSTSWASAALAPTWR